MTLLPLSIVTCHSTVSSLSLDDVVLIEENRGHETERTKALSNDVRLNVTVVVLASPHDATVSLDNLSDHIINESVLVVNASLFEISLVMLHVQVHEDILEETVVLLQDGVLSRQLKGILSVEGILEASVSEGGN